MERNISPTHIDLYICYYGNQQCPPGHSWGPAVKTHYKIHYIRSGWGTLTVRNTTFVIGPGQGFLICPHELVYYEADKEAPWDYAWIAFNGLHADGYLKRAGVSANNPVFTLREPENMENFFTQLLAINEPVSDLSMLRLQAYLLQFFALLLQNNGGGARAPVQSEMYVEQVIRYIQMNYSNHITVSGIAEHIGLDRKYLSTLFKSITQTTIQNYIMQYRLDVACELMKDTEMHIGSIARSVGYTDPMLFSKMFRKYRTLTPTEYRAQLNIKLNYNV